MKRLLLAITVAALAACTNQAGITCSDATASNGTTYYYVVKATNAGSVKISAQERPEGNSITPSAQPVVTQKITVSPGSFTFNAR